MRLALYQPDIPQNAGTLMRLCACMGLPMDIVEPCGFILSDKNLKRAGMDYMDRLALTRHSDWEAFRAQTKPARVVLLTTKSDTFFHDFCFRQDDILLLGRESAGVPDCVHDNCDARITIPIAAGLRSLNVAVAGAMAIGEALRQTGQFPAPPA